MPAPQLPAIRDLKSQAKRLRTVLNERHQSISHSAALELMAAQYGYRDWNSLHAAAGKSEPPACPYQVGDQVTGRYLGQSFRATILTVQTRSDPTLFRVTFDLDEPVNVVRFDSFSAYRKRITLTLRKDGTTMEKTSDGHPHMVLDLIKV